MQPMQPMVSVIMPSYNHSAFISRALESVFKQRYPNYEVVVVDDGSTDATIGILAGYRYRIQLLEGKRVGPGGCRNKGIKASVGEYIAFLDSDDLWLPDKVQKQVDFLNRHKSIGLVFSDATIFNEEPGGVERQLGIMRYRGPLSLTGLFRNNFIPICSVMVRRSVLDTVGLFAERDELASGVDYHLWLRIARRFQLGHIPEILASYRVHSENMAGTNRNKNYRLHLTVIEKILDSEPGIERELGVDKNTYFASCWERFGRDLYRNGYCREAVEYFRSARSYRPYSLSLVGWQLRALIGAHLARR